MEGGGRTGGSAGEGRGEPRSREGKGGGRRGERSGGGGASGHSACARQGLCCRDGTPGGQSVAERFQVSWETVMVSSHGAVVLKCDGRGSGFQGTKLLHEVGRRLGALEEKDQTEAVR